MSADSTLPALGPAVANTGRRHPTPSPADTRHPTQSPADTRTSRIAARAVLAAAPQITSSAPSRVNDPAHFN